MVTYIQVVRQIVFSLAKVIVIGGTSDLKMIFLVMIDTL